MSDELKLCVMDLMIEMEKLSREMQYVNDYGDFTGFCHSQSAITDRFRLATIDALRECRELQIRLGKAKTAGLALAPKSTNQA